MGFMTISPDSEKLSRTYSLNSFTLIVPHQIKFVRLSRRHISRRLSPSVEWAYSPDRIQRLVEPYREMPINRRFTSQKAAGLAIATTGDPKTPSIHELPLGRGRIARKRATLPPRTRHALQRRRSSLQMQRIFQSRRWAPRTSPAGPCLAWSTRTRSNGPAPRERRPHSLRSRPRRPGPSFSTTASRRVASPLSRRACR